MSSDTVLRVVGVMAALRGPTPQPVKTKAPGDSRRLSVKYFDYRFAVLSKQVLFAAAQPVVVGATVMSPRAVIVYTFPPTTFTPVLESAFVVTPVYRVLIS